MSSSIIEDVLGTKNVYLDKYLSDTISLAQSIVLCSRKEARLYNELVSEKYPDIEVYTTAPHTWRYYRHITGQPYMQRDPLNPNQPWVDDIVEVISRDNGQLIELTPTALELHLETRKELLKYGLYYTRLIEKYPEQELYIKTIINYESLRFTLNDILEIVDPLTSTETKDDYIIMSYGLGLVEYQEYNLIYKLQERIDNYIVSKTLPYYSIAENLYMTSLYHVLYSFILTSLFAIRLDNAKTISAHSYHILNYLASHHGIDIHYNKLNLEQVMFIYRNILYLNNHSGSEETLRTLVDRLFTPADISVVGYSFDQTNILGPDNWMEYVFKQELINSDTSMYYNNKDFTFDDMIQKETERFPKNRDHYSTEKNNVDHLFNNTKDSNLFTKDLETLFMDVSDEVKHKLRYTIIDYWAYSLYLGTSNYIINFNDPTTNIEYTLTTEEAFKFYTILLHLYNFRDFEALYPDDSYDSEAFAPNAKIPSYYIWRVLKENRPSDNFLFTHNYLQPSFELENDIRLFRDSYPDVSGPLVTASFFRQLVEDVYKYNIGTWIYLTNTHDLYHNAQLEMALGYLHTNVEYKQMYNGQEDEVFDFLNRMALSDVIYYDKETLYQLMEEIVDLVSMNVKEIISLKGETRLSMVDILRKFKSYTTQILDREQTDINILTIFKSIYTSTKSSIHDTYYVDTNFNYLEINSTIVDLDTKDVEVSVDVDLSDETTEDIFVEIPVSIDGVGATVRNAIVGLHDFMVGYDHNYPIPENPPDQDRMLFLSFNQ